MKAPFLLVIFLCLAHLAISQTSPHTEECTVCKVSVTVLAFKKGETYYLKFGKELRNKIGSKLSTGNVIKAYSATLSKKVAAFCGKQPYSPAAFINFVDGFAQRAAVQLAPRKTAGGIPVLVDSIRLDNTLYLGLIRIGPGLYIISLLGAAKPLDLMVWDDQTQHYQFNTAAFKDQAILFNSLPQFLWLKDSVAKIDLPQLYLLPKADSTYEMITSDKDAQGAPSGVILTAAIGNNIKLSGRTLTIDGSDQTVNTIKMSNGLHLPPANLKPLPAPKASSKKNAATDSAGPAKKSLAQALDSAEKKAKSLAAKIVDSTSITVLTAANFDFTGKLSASYLGLLNIFAPDIHGSKYGLIAGIEKINYSPGNINGNDSSQVQYFVQNYIPNPLQVNRLQQSILPGSKYVQQYNQYTYTASNTVWSFYFQPTWKILPLNNSDDRQGVFFHLHTELLVNQWTRTANVKTLTQSDSITAGNFVSDTNFYWVQKNPIVSNYNFLSPYFGAGLTLFVNPFPATNNSFFFGQATFGLAYNTPNFQELNNPLDRPEPNGTYTSNNITNPRAKAFFLFRFSFSQVLSSKSTLQVGTVMRGILPTSTPQYAAFLGLNIDLTALAGLITGK